MLASLPVLAGCLLAPAHEFTIPLERASVQWKPSTGLELRHDGRLVLGGVASPFVFHNETWGWGHHVRLDGENPVATDADGKGATIRYRDAEADCSIAVRVTGVDEITVAFEVSQTGWQEGARVQAGLGRPPVDVFSGVAYHGDAEGTLPTEYGTANPIRNVRALALDLPLVRFSMNSEQPLTWFDYAARESFWVGRDLATPKGEVARWAVRLRFEPRPETVEGIAIERVGIAGEPRGQTADLALRLARTETGPASVTAVVTGVGPAGPLTLERELTLAPTPGDHLLPLEFPVPGPYTLRLELHIAGAAVWTSQELIVTAPQLLRLTPGRVPYSTESEGSILARIAPGLGEDLHLSVRVGETEVYAGDATGETVRVALALSGSPLGATPVTASLTQGETRIATAACSLVRVEAAPSSVVPIDNERRCLLVGGLPFVACGFYTDCLPAERAIRVISGEAPAGANAVTFYMPTAIDERRARREEIRAVLDRCAELGMRAQLDVRIASKPPHSEEKWEWLREEVEAFRDHPALLSYYLADEPELGWAKPEDCEEAYRRLKELDPCHPVTQVFCQSPAAARYRDSYDIVMTDPYPIPNSSVLQVTDFCRGIQEDLGRSRILWLVPQAFGGGEWWSREPSTQEERAMVYLGLLEGGTGVQYFVLRPPVGNPTSPVLWGECRRLLCEAAWLTPALTAPEADQGPPVACDAPDVRLRGYLSGDTLTVLAVNPTAEPRMVRYVCGGGPEGAVEALFENRTVPLAAGAWTDTIEAMGTRAYRLALGAPTPGEGLAAGNLLVNPSFEEMHNVGTPDGFYTRLAADLGASWAVDTRTAVHGRQSLRLTTPAGGPGIGLSPYPMTLEKGRRYRLSVEAKGSAEGLRFLFDPGAVADGGEFALQELTTDWKHYEVEFTAAGGRSRYSGVWLRLESGGVAWFDLLQGTPVE